MDELVRGLSRFLYRDVLYMIGGTAVILSFLYLFDRVPSSTLPLAYYLFGGGIAYVVGYVAQEFFCLIGVCTTADYFQPYRPLRSLYHHFTREPWPMIERFNTIDAWIKISRDRTGTELFERILFHKQVGTTMGPCAVLSALFLFARRWNPGALPSSFDTALAGAAFFLGVVLLLLGWLKGVQQIRWLHALNEERLTTGSSGPAGAGRSA